MIRQAVYVCFGAALLGLCSATGCRYDTVARVGRDVRQVSCTPMDVTVPASPSRAPGREGRGSAPGDLLPPPSEPLSQPSAQNEPGRAVVSHVVYQDDRHPGTMRTAFVQPAADAAAKKPRPLEIPKDLPGSEAPPIEVPPLRPGETPEERRSEIEKLYEGLPAMESFAAPKPAPGQTPLSLEELQRIALSQSPVIRQAAADLESARGNAIQAGLAPNPHVGYQADTINTGRTGGYQGVGLTQTVPTGGKLKLARAAACVDADSAELMLRRARYDVATRVRSNYFAALVALEKYRVNYALWQFAERICRIQLARVPAGQAAAYEPLQVRVPAMQAQAQLVQSRREYEAAWRRLAAAIDCPEMPPTALAGSTDWPVPPISYEGARDRTLQVHTDLLIARNSVTRARYQLEKARITPVVPDLDLTMAIQRDFSTFQYPTTVSVQLLAPIPIFDNNRGNIMAAEAALTRAHSEYNRVRNDLLTNLADSFARYQISTTTLQYYREGILLDQVRVYRGVHARYETQEGADFSDTVTAEQTLASTIATYLQTLGDQWQAVVELAGLMQVDDLFQMQ